MKRSIKKQWLKDLRSGKYKQGTRRLMTLEDNSYCCIGVLVDGAARELINSAGCAVVIPDPPRRGGLGIAYKQEGAYPACSIHDIPLQALAVVGLNPVLQDRLIAMNDEDEKDFKQIADWISRNVKTEDD